MSIERAANDIRRAYMICAAELDTDDRWVRMAQVAELLHLDLTAAEFGEAVRHLLRTVPSCEIMTEINQKTLTPMDLAYRVEFAGSFNDLIWI